jgi:hypothetical protein
MKQNNRTMKNQSPFIVEGKFTDDVIMRFCGMQGGVQIEFFKEDKRILSAIRYEGNYGDTSLLWEIMVAHPMKKWHDAVTGHLTFAEVLRFVRREMNFVED